jgi:uncharacterized protein
MMNNELALKKERLYSSLYRYKTLGVAFSGGIDSTLLLAVSRELFVQNVIAFTAVSPIHGSVEKELAVSLARRLDVQHVLVESREMDDHEFILNTPQRCYHCKKSLMTILLSRCRELGLEALAHGVNLDDMGDFRPGLKAAEELGVVAPLRDARLTKDDIRYWAREMGLPNWDRPAMACLASRIPYGTQIREETLRMIEKAEKVIGDAGIVKSRIRHHGDLASLEVDPADIPRVTQEPLRSWIVQRLRALGYSHICLDMEGYLTGKMNRGITKTDPRLCESRNIKV